LIIHHECDIIESVKRPRSVCTVFDSPGGDFIHGTNPPAGDVSESLWFVFMDDRLLVRETAAGLDVEKAAALERAPVHDGNAQFIGWYRGAACYAAAVSPKNRASRVREGSFRNLRSLYGIVPDPVFALAGRAYQIVNWTLTHRFCGRCGGRTMTLPGERVMRCRRCRHDYYPRISPAVLVGVIRGDSILLARGHSFPKPWYSLIAGFVEPGETLEQCAAREVREETGIEIGEIRYFGSQPWPFSHSLMIAFTARYLSGEIKLDTRELKDAGWFARAALPDLPGELSLSRKLIDWFNRG